MVRVSVARRVGVGGRAAGLSDLLLLRPQLRLQPLQLLHLLHLLLRLPSRPLLLRERSPPLLLRL